MYRRNNMLIEKGKTTSRIFTTYDNVYKVAEDEKHILAILRDECPESPREWDNMGVMVCFHNKYNLGDKNHGYSKDEYGNWDELEKAIWEEEDPVVVLPLYLYDHSGITIKTSPFSSSWDSGKIGFIFARKKDVKEMLLIETIVGAAEKRVTDILKGEVETYDQYLRGDIYGFVIEDKDGNELEACGGFYGDDPEENGMKDHISKEYHHLIEKLEGRWG